MTDVERRLRAGLAGLADELPPSRDPWSEQQHRQRAAGQQHRRSVRPHRRPLVALAATAVVLAVGVVPAAITRPVPRPGDPSGRPGITYDPSPDGGPYLAVTDGPVPLGEFTEAGTRWAASVFVERQPEGTGWAYRLCVVGVAPGRPVNDPDQYPNSSGCVPVPGWPAGPPGALVRTRPVLGGSTPGSGPLPGLLLFVTSPEVARLEARTAFGAPAPVRELGRNSALALFLGDFGPSFQGFGYVARDVAGRVVEQAIS